MYDTNFIKRGLARQGLPFYEADLPYISQILDTINQAKAPLQTFPLLNEETPITIVDKELLLYD